MDPASELQHTRLVTYKLIYLLRLVFFSALGLLLFLLVRLPIPDVERMQALLLVAVLSGVGLAVTMSRRKLHDRIAEQLRFNEQLIDAIPQPLSLRSVDGRFILVNRAFERRFGLGRELLVGHRVDEALPKDAAARILSMDARAAAAVEPQEDTFHVETPAGVRHVKVIVQGLRRSDGSLIGTIGIQDDVSELTETNEKLSRLSMKMIGAQEQERRRIARDLHDQVGQILTALKLQLASLGKRPGIEQPAQALAAPIDLTEEALRHTRDLSASLHPHLLDDLGLEAAVRWLLDRFIRPALPQAELRCRLDPPRGPESIELVAFRVVQEALTNVVRHSRATRAIVMLETVNGELTIEVMDDGVGFALEGAGGDMRGSMSVGMTGMRDRIAETGGELHVHSVPGQGTSVRARLSWARQPAEATA